MRISSLLKRAPQASPEIINFLRQYIEQANKEGFRKCSYSIQPALRVNPPNRGLFIPPEGYVTGRKDNTQVRAERKLSYVGSLLIDNQGSVVNYRNCFRFNGTSFLGES
jgi:hypothetical protein